jgi:hypothetical protein
MDHRLANDDVVVASELLAVGADYRQQIDKAKYAAAR